MSVLPTRLGLHKLATLPDTSLDTLLPRPALLTLSDEFPTDYMLPQLCNEDPG